ncbi:MAG: hypothetical protein DI576_01000 [Actinomyces sp.]|nr:MAG: hypothetical protein DI576_01000 [Actinomyces sp.]
MITRHVPVATGSVALALVLALGSPATAQEAGVAVVQPVVASPTGASQLSTVRDLMAAYGLPQTVTTSGHLDPGDGAGMTYSVRDTNVSGILGNIAVPTADGQWAVPTGLPEHPSTQADAASVEDEIARAQSFADAGAGLVRDDARPSPLTSSGVVHAGQSTPYPISDASFVGMTLMGWDYSHTTYVADENTRVGTWVDFGQTSGSDLAKAHELARWFYVNGDLWLSTADDYQRGDILFFSRQSPGGAGTTGDYFANVYHTAIYLGDGMIAHSWGDSGAGVVVEPLPDSLKQDLSLVARPALQGAPAPTQVGTPSAEATEEPQISDPAPADPTSQHAEDPATSEPDPGSGDATIAIEDAVPGESPSSEQKDVIVAADPPRHHRDGLLASTGAGGVFALVAAALLGAGVLLRLRRRPGGHPDI